MNYAIQFTLLDNLYPFFISVCYYVLGTALTSPLATVF